MKKFIMGLMVGMIIAFPLGINFGKDAPLLSNPFAARPDISKRMVERTEDLVEGAKGAIHEATKPVREKLQK